MLAAASVLSESNFPSRVPQRPRARGGPLGPGSARPDTEKEEDKRINVRIVRRMKTGQLVTASKLYLMTCEGETGMINQ